jgi:hypothetical protein
MLHAVEKQPSNPHPIRLTALNKKSVRHRLTTLPTTGIIFKGK